MNTPTRLLTVCASALLLATACSDADPGADAGVDAAPLPTQGRAFVDDSLDAAAPTQPVAMRDVTPSEPAEDASAEPADTDVAAATTPEEAAPTMAERVEDIAYEATSAALDAAPDGIDSALDDPEAFAADVAGEVSEEVAAVADGAGADLEAGSVAPPADDAGLLAGAATGEHNSYQPLPRAFETDEIDPDTGVPVLERDGGDILVMSFEDLAYADYIPRDPLADDVDDLPPHEFPQRLTKFDGRRATIDGFMIPTSFRDGKVREFILSGDPPYCCFGGFPPIDRAIDITLPDDHPGVEYSSYGVFRVIGELSIGETFDEYGYVLGIYQLRADTVAEEF